MCRVCNIRFSVVYLLLCSCARVFVITACQCVRVTNVKKRKKKKKRLHSERSRGNFHLSDTRDIPPPWIHTYSLFVISIQIFAFRICLTFFLFFILFLSFFHRSFLSAKHHGRFLPTIRDKVLLLSLVLCISFSVLCSPVFLWHIRRREREEKKIYRAYPTNRRSIVRLVSRLFFPII